MRLIRVGDNDGVGYVDILRMLRSMELLNQDFAAANVQFFISSFAELDLNPLYTHTSSSSGSALAQGRTQRGVMNTFIVGEDLATPVSEGGGSICGYATPNTNYLIMSKECIGTGDRTWSHEMGHVYTLPHTFYGWESVGEIENIERTERAPETLRYRGADVPVERVDGSNCADAADGFCDTAPDYLMERWACTIENEYRDSLTDPDSTRFAVPGGNIMSYVSDACIGDDGFTDEQEAAMLTNLAGRNDINRDESGEGLTAQAPDGENMTLLLPEDNATIENSNYVELHWATTEHADFYIVQINNTNNFNGSVLNTFITTDTMLVIEDNLLPNRRYHWRVRPLNRYKIDSEFSDDFRFRNGEFAVATIDAGLNAAITIAPNPVFGGQDLRINGQDLGESGALTYELIDPAGRILISRENIRVNATGFNERLQTSALSAGVYFLRIRLNGKLVTRRIVVTP